MKKFFRVKFLSGFTLLEVLIALAIAGGLFSTIISTVNYHISVALANEAKTQTVLLAQLKMQQIKKDPVNQEGHFESPFEDYLYKAEVWPSPYAGLNAVTVTVRADKEEFVVSEYVVK